MAKRIGILTAGGDCPGLNSAIRGVAKATYHRMPGAEIYGIAEGFSGLITGEYKKMSPSDFSGILNVGGTILGSSRTPYKMMRVIEADSVDKVAKMKQNYEKMELDCLLCLGGNGTHKNAHLLAEEGLNVIGLPKTIDNDIWGTEFTFGFHTAVRTGSDILDKLHTTAASHGRTLVVEIMGNKAGWLTLYAAVAGGADVVLLPEIPFEIDSVVDALNRRVRAGKDFSIIAVAEGAISASESKMKRKDRLAARSAAGDRCVSDKLVRELTAKTELEIRSCVPGHILRGGSPSPYDRILATQFGVYAAQLIYDDVYGVAVGISSDRVRHSPLEIVAGKTKFVPKDNQLIDAARHMGLNFGD